MVFPHCKTNWKTRRNPQLLLSVQRQMGGSHFTIVRWHIKEVYHYSQMVPLPWKSNLITTVQMHFSIRLLLPRPRNWSPPQTNAHYWHMDWSIHRILHKKRQFYTKLLPWSWGQMSNQMCLHAPENIQLRSVLSVHKRYIYHENLF